MTISLSLQLITVSLIIIQRTFIHESISTRNTLNEKYDYIIVGAGSAGAVVANRLSENPRITVLLLEAGGPQTVVTDIPGSFPVSLSSELQLFWNYATVPQNNFGFAYKRIIEIPQGYIIGGTSSINGMVYNRGNPIVFDKWVNDYGAQGWGYKEVLPYFIKSENNTDFNVISKNPGYHGTDGPMGVSSDPNPTPLQKYMLKAFNEMGLQTVDINGAQQLGTAISQYTFRNGIRQSTGNAYIDPNPHPNNLQILTNCLVTKVLFKQTNEGLKAIGVQFMKNNTLFEVKSKREVILSAGAIRSPHLLLLSGIGPKEHLRKFNIKSIADLPVGQNLQDHPQVPITAIVNNYIPNTTQQFNIDQLYKVLTNGSGPLARRDNLVVYHNSRSNQLKYFPNCFTEIDYQGPITHSSYSSYLNRTDQWMRYFEPYLGQNSTMFYPKLFEPKSRGHISLASNNPSEYPSIDPKYLSHPQDIKDYIDCTKFILYYIINTSISKYLSLIPEPIPGCKLCPNRPVYDCDSYIECMIRTLGTTDHHLVGTCRMGAVERSDTVVDPSLRVKGIGGLRVCDASVMPLIPNANTNAATVMVGEKCSQIIKTQQNII